MRKHVLVALLIGMGMSTPLMAQLQISCRLEPTRAVQYEPIIAVVRIQNNTGRTVTLQDDTADARLWMEIEKTPGRTMRQISPFVLGEPLVIEPRQTVTQRVNLTQMYDVRNTGPYTVRARVDWGGDAFASGKIFLDVVPGLEMQRMVGPVGPDGTGRRIYRLLSLNRDRGDHLFLRIDDEAQGLCYGVIHLGRMLRIQNPTMQVDAANNINVLHQAGPGRYLHHVFTPNGDQVQRRAYTSDDPGVSLAESRDGRVMVEGAASSMHDDH